MGSTQSGNDEWISAEKERPRIDLMAEARATQRHDEASRGSAGAIKLIAPAKVNLILGIGSLRKDGFHQVINVMHTIMLHDVVHIKHAPGVAGVAGLTIRVETTSRQGVTALDIPAEDNIAYKAVAMLAQRLGRTQHETIDVYIEKHIPFQAGLGGGSSDAAAALIGAAYFWDVSIEDPMLETIAGQLGSDVAFFLKGGCACFEGKGERFKRAFTPMKKALVLIKPDEGVSTAAAYKAFDRVPQPLSKAAEYAVQQAERAEELPLFNNIAPASESILSKLTEIRLWAQAQPGVTEVLLCGSGSSTFAICTDFAEACNLSVAARQRGWWARTTSFGNVRAALV